MVDPIPNASLRSRCASRLGWARWGAWCLTGLATLGALWGCVPRDEAPTPGPVSPRSQYHIFWRDVGLTYPFFQRHRVNWDSVGALSLSRLNESSSRSQLFEEIAQSLSTLIDGHASLNDPTTGRRWLPARPNYYPEFYLPVVMQRYLLLDTTGWRGRRRLSGILPYSRPQGPRQAMYVYIRSFTDEGAAAELDVAIRQGQRTGDGITAVIVDVRNNTGGLIREADQMASTLTRQAYPFQRIRYRNGPGAGDFTAPELQSTRPYVSDAWRGPVFLLTNRYSASASERLRMALSRRPGGSVCVGDTTLGALSPVVERRLAGGLTYVVVGSEVTDMEGEFFEGRGIPPDVRAGSGPSVLLPGGRLGRDLALERVMELLP